MSMADDIEYGIDEYMRGDYDCTDFTERGTKWVPKSLIGHRVNLDSIEICRFFVFANLPKISDLFDEL